VITFDPEALGRRREELERQTIEPGFWDDQKRAAGVSSELTRTQRRLETYERLRADAGELDGMLEMAAEDDEWRAELEATLDRLGRAVARLQEEALFTGEYDAGPAVVTVHAGAGGTDSQDWVEMLLRMYQRWADARGFKTRLLEVTPGEEAGLKSATFTLEGENAYGIMQVEIAPLVDDDLDVEVDEGDLRIDTYRSQGAGGQHVNKTDSAVRITHLPSGIVVQCQNERSQLQNRAQAMRILRSRLIEREEEQRREAMARERGEAQDISFGSQIRSYVMHPYSMVRDERTELKIGNVQGVLDGDLDGLIHAYLLQRAATGDHPSG
jgi:peptide chain release factor 2